MEDFGSPFGGVLALFLTFFDIITGGNAFFSHAPSPVLLNCSLSGDIIYANKYPFKLV